MGLPPALVSWLGFFKGTLGPFCHLQVALPFAALGRSASLLPFPTGTLRAAFQARPRVLHRPPGWMNSK